MSPRKLVYDGFQDALLQHFPDRSQQALSFARRKRTALALWVNPSGKQSLIGVNIAQPSQKRFGPSGGA